MIRLMLSACLAMLAVPLSAKSRVAEVEAVERAWNAAIVSQDMKALERILAPEFKLIWINGAVSGRAANLAAVRDRKATIDPFETEEREVRIYGQTAIVTGAFTQTYRLGAQHETGRFRYTDVYVRRGGRWQAVAAQASMIPDARPKP